MTARQHTVMAWALLALGRGLLYTPVFPGYGDFPLPLRTLFSEDKVWISGVVWLLIGATGVAYALHPRLPLWFTRAWWTVLVMGVAGWGALYVSSIFLAHNLMTYKLMMAGELYLALAYAIAFTRGEEPEPNAWRQRRDRSTPPGGQ